MKCYISTFYQYDNYGTRLQNYALMKTLEKLNIETKTIYIKNNKNIIKEKIKSFFSLVPLTKKQKQWKNNKLKNKVFSKFNDELEFEFIRKSELSRLNESCDFCIAGSDQIWSPMHLEKNKDDIDLFFLKFVEEKKRFSYAPSFGTTEIPENMKKIYCENLSKFSSLSVREKSGKKIIDELINVDAFVAPDPVFLLSKDDWENILIENNIKKNYIVLYFLSDQSEKIMKEIYDFAKKEDLVIIDIMGNDYEKNKKIVDPIEFISLIKHANYIFTDSFHASVFSIIFNKLFMVFKRTDVNQMTRVNNLLDNFNCKDFEYKGNLISVKKLKYDFKVNDKLNDERLKGINFLENIKEGVDKYDRKSYDNSCNL